MKLWSFEALALTGMYVRWGGDHTTRVIVKCCLLNSLLCLWLNLRAAISRAASGPINWPVCLNDEPRATNECWRLCRRQWNQVLQPSSEHSRTGSEHGLQNNWDQSEERGWSAEVIYSGSDQDADTRDQRDTAGGGRRVMKRERSERKVVRHQQGFSHFTQLIKGLFWPNKCWWFSLTHFFTLCW